LLLTVIGLGRLGLVHAAVMAKLGHQVIGIEMNEDRVSQLMNGSTPFFEPGLEILLDEVLSSGRLTFQTEHLESSREADIHFICVGTPQSTKGDEADTSYVFDAIVKLAPFMHADAVVVGKSTVPVGTAAAALALLNKTSGKKHNLVWNPEFLREGHAVADTMRPDRVVIGRQSSFAESVLRDCYKEILNLGTPVVSCDFETSELVKVAANAFLATKISFINAIAELAESTGADTELIADALGLDDRIGRKFLNNGLGYGGGCLPKDTRSLRAIANKLETRGLSDLLDSVEVINAGRKTRVLDLAKDQLGDLSGKRVVILGAAFKPNTDDIRDSPAIELADLFAKHGASVAVQDEMASQVVAAQLPHFEAFASVESAASGADLLVLATEWASYSAIAPKEIGELVAQKNLIVARKSIDPRLWKDHGWNVKILGHG
jgi:UDPglucose 6-dehydrogenase